MNSSGLTLRAALLDVLAEDLCSAQCSRCVAVWFLRMVSRSDAVDFEARLLADLDRGPRAPGRRGAIALPTFCVSVDLETSRSAS